MRMYYVYDLVDPVSHLVRYVGLTTRPIEERYRFHCKGWGKESPTAAWVRSLPYPPILVVLRRRRKSRSHSRVGGWSGRLTSRKRNGSSVFAAL